MLSSTSRRNLNILHSDLHTRLMIKLDLATWRCGTINLFLRDWDGLHLPMNDHHQKPSTLKNHQPYRPELQAVSIFCNEEPSPE